MGDEWDEAAARLRRKSEDLQAYVRALGAKLLDALPGQATARRGGLFGPPVAAVVVDLGDVRYELEIAHPGEHVMRSQLVRGVAIKSGPITLDAFVSELTDRLRAAAATDEAALTALERLLL